MNPVNAAEQVKQRKQLTDAEKSYLNELRLKYFTHCNMKDDPVDNDNADDADNNDGTSNKRRSVETLMNKRENDRNH